MNEMFYDWSVRTPTMEQMFSDWSVRTPTMEQNDPELKEYEVEA